MRKSGAQQQADVLRQEILSAESRVTSGRMFYYISSEGNDANDGKTPETPIQSLTKLSTLPLRSGDRILFRRGDMFRIQEPIGARGGVSYGAYGIGAKPIISGSARDYADEFLWSSFTKTIWMLFLPYKAAGVMTFNEERITGVRKQTLDGIKEDGDYYHDIEKGILYLQCTEGNPGTYYHNIEIGTAPELILAQNVNDVTIDNLCLKHATELAVNLGNNKEIRIHNCEMSWIGGAYYRDNIRYGNAVQFWYRADDVMVEKCWFYEVYDAAVTFQGLGPDSAIFRNIVFRDNLIENCSMNIEYWAGNADGSGPQPIISDILIEGNIIRFGGYGWGGIQRPDLGDQALFLAWGRHYKNCENLYVTDNIFDCGDCSLVWSLPPEEQKGLHLSGNSYYQCETAGRNPFSEVIRGQKLKATDQQSLETAVFYFDKEPKEVKWVEVEINQVVKGEKI